MSRVGCVLTSIFLFSSAGCASEESGVSFGWGGENKGPGEGALPRLEHLFASTEPVSATEPAPAPEAAASGCPAGMIRVAGEYCPTLAGGDHRCIRWMDPPSAIARRCAEYAPGTACRGETVHLEYCIDRHEYCAAGETLPQTDVSWHQARALCAASGKRLCTSDEWTLACEGSERLPYPYGYTRRPELSNIDRDKLLAGGKFIDQRTSIYEHPDCLSSFGVHNMTGNVGEWTFQTTAQPPFRSAGKGGWWGPLRSRCRATTVGHDEYFHQIQIGFRCCSDSAEP
jgi:hypothetical protein